MIAPSFERARLPPCRMRVPYGLSSRPRASARAAGPAFHRQGGRSERAAWYPVSQVLRIFAKLTRSRVDARSAHSQVGAAGREENSDSVEAGRGAHVQYGSTTVLRGAAVLVSLRKGLRKPANIAAQGSAAMKAALPAEEDDEPEGPALYTLVSGPLVSVATAAAPAVAALARRLRPCRHGPCVPGAAPAPAATSAAARASGCR